MERSEKIEVIGYLIYLMKSMMIDLLKNGHYTSIVFKNHYQTTLIQTVIAKLKGQDEINKLSFYGEFMNYGLYLYRLWSQMDTQWDAMTVFGNQNGLFFNAYFKGII